MGVNFYNSYNTLICSVNEKSNPFKSTTDPY